LENEKSLFFGNEDKVIQNECGYILGILNKNNQVIEWNINKID